MAVILTSSGQNAFSCLDRFDFSIYDALVVDSLHEIELGVWKTLYIHLLRLLEASKKRENLAELDERCVYLAFSRSLARAHGPSGLEMFQHSAVIPFDGSHIMHRK